MSSTYYQCFHPTPGYMSTSQLAIRGRPASPALKASPLITSATPLVKPTPATAPSSTPVTTPRPSYAEIARRTPPTRLPRFFSPLPFSPLPVGLRFFAFAFAFASPLAPQLSPPRRILAAGPLFSLFKLLWAGCHDTLVNIVLLFVQVG